MAAAAPAAALAAQDPPSAASCVSAKVGEKKDTDCQPSKDEEGVMEDGGMAEAAAVRPKCTSVTAAGQKIKLMCDEVTEALSDIDNCLRPLRYDNVLGRKMSAAMSDGKKDKVTRLLNEVLPARLAWLEQRLGDSDYFCGGSLTTCDLQWYVMGSGFLDSSYCVGVEPAVLDNCPRLKALIARVEELPSPEESPPKRRKRRRRL